MKGARCTESRRTPKFVLYHMKLAAESGWALEQGSTMGISYRASGVPIFYRHTDGSRENRTFPLIIVMDAGAGGARHDGDVVDEMNSIISS